MDVGSSYAFALGCWNFLTWRVKLIFYGEQKFMFIIPCCICVHNLIFSNSLLAGRFLQKPSLLMHDIYLVSLLIRKPISVKLFIYTFILLCALYRRFLGGSTVLVQLTWHSLISCAKHHCLCLLAHKVKQRYKVCIL